MSTFVYRFNLASANISDDLYYPNRQFLKQYISLAPNRNETPIMTPPSGENAFTTLTTTLSSINPLNQTNINNIDEWLLLDSNNGFIRLYDPNDASSSYPRSKLVPCTMWTTIEQICSRLNNDLDPRTWYVQYHGDRIQHLRPDEKPLFIQHNYLLSIGFSSIQRLQQEGDKHDLGYLIRFLSGRENEYSSVRFFFNYFVFV